MSEVRRLGGGGPACTPPPRPHPNCLQPAVPSAPCRCCFSGLALPVHLSISIASLSASQFSIAATGPLSSWHGVPAFVVKGIWCIDPFVVGLAPAPDAALREGRGNLSQVIPSSWTRLPCVPLMVWWTGAYPRRLLFPRAKAVISRTLSQVFRKTGLSCIHCLFARAADVTSCCRMPRLWPS